MKNNEIEYTTLDEVIQELSELRKRYSGDTAICVNGKALVYLIERPYYYDGGFDAKKADEEKWLNSKNYDKGSCSKKLGFPNSCIDFVEHIIFDDIDENIEITWSEPDQIFIAKDSKTSVVTQGDTPDEARQKMREILESLKIV